MSRETTIACDACGRPIGAPYGALVLMIRSATEPQADATADLCSRACLTAWVARWPQERPPR